MSVSDYVQAIKSRALELNGTTVVVELSSGKTLTGTLAYTLTTDVGGSRRC
ncbi:hypothetical protein [Streptomyces litmocidini]|uniref:hypothetical protein n=1 Tax=Streptomyces litmocidini TaxID=67318 RepID=UPI003701D09E